MKLLNQTLLIALLVIVVMLGMRKVLPPQVQTETVEYVERQHPNYPLIEYDIREALPPSRRTYMRYPYYFSRYGIYSR